LALPPGTMSSRTKRRERAGQGKSLVAHTLSRNGRAAALVLWAGALCRAHAGVAELVDALDSKSSSGDRVSVRVRPPAPSLNFCRGDPATPRTPSTLSRRIDLRKLGQPFVSQREYGYFLRRPDDQPAVQGRLQSAQVTNPRKAKPAQDEPEDEATAA
jgi:hypothetical protein